MRLAEANAKTHHSILPYTHGRTGRDASRGEDGRLTKLLSTEAGLRAVTRWFLQRDILTQFSLARISDDAKTRRRGRRPGTYVDEDDDEC